MARSYICHVEVVHGDLEGERSRCVLLRTRWSHCSACRTGAYADCRGHDLDRPRQLPHVNLHTVHRDPKLLKGQQD